VHPEHKLMGKKKKKKKKKEEEKKQEEEKEEKEEEEEQEEEEEVSLGWHGRILTLNVWMSPRPKLTQI